ncbi:MAG: 50S ribosomal protein L13 [Deltaproteobacteria bacterium]|nr:50S ribosomal protein L13 [Deltaproteobacteria bacterium]
MKTFFAKEQDVTREWYLIDADSKVLGHLAVEVARRLKGKHKAIYTPHADTGDFIVVINAEKTILTGKKETDKIYYRHSGYPGGLKQISAGKLLDESPEKLIMKAVKGMLPKNSLGRRMLKKLKVYRGNKHRHEAQMPQSLEI